VRQTIEDCLTEAMDLDGLMELLQRIENGAIECIARDLPEPSPLAHEILNAKPYAFLDNAPLEERRTQAVYTRRAGESSADAGLGILDAAAIERVCEEAWPRASNADELHEALVLLGVMTEEEARQCVAEPSRAGVAPVVSVSMGTECELGSPTSPADQAPGRRDAYPTLSAALIESLIAENRAGRLTTGRVQQLGEAAAGSEIAPAETRPRIQSFLVAAERIPLVRAVYPGSAIQPPIAAPEAESKRHWERAEAIRELIRGRIEAVGPTTAGALASFSYCRPPKSKARCSPWKPKDSFCAADFIRPPRNWNGATGGCWRGFIG